MQTRREPKMIVEGQSSRNMHLQREICFGVDMHANMGMTRGGYSEAVREGVEAGRRRLPGWVEGMPREGLKTQVEEREKERRMGMVRRAPLETRLDVRS